MTLCHLCALIAKVLTWRGVCRGGSGESSLQWWARVPCSHMEVAPMIQTTYCRRDIDVLGAMRLKSLIILTLFCFWWQWIRAILVKMILQPTIFNAVVSPWTLTPAARDPKLKPVVEAMPSRTMIANIFRLILCEVESGICLLIAVSTYVFN